MIEKLEDKYADLLINRCLNFNNSNALFISYYVDNANFVKNLLIGPYSFKPPSLISLLSPVTIVRLRSFSFTSTTHPASV